MSALTRSDLTLLGALALALAYTVWLCVQAMRADRRVSRRYRPNEEE